MVTWIHPLYADIYNIFLCKSLYFPPQKKSSEKSGIVLQFYKYV